MKLASALAERSDLQRRADQLSIRLNNNAKVQEGDLPAEDPDELLKELDSVLARLEELIVRINLTNSKAELDGVTLTELLAKRDCMVKRMNIMRHFLDCSSCRVNRNTKTEIKINSTVSVKELQKENDRISKELRLLDEKIQQLNWTTELL